MKARVSLLLPFTNISQRKKIRKEGNTYTNIAQSETEFSMHELGFTFCVCVAFKIEFSILQVFKFCLSRVTPYVTENPVPGTSRACGWHWLPLWD